MLARPSFAACSIQHRPVDDVGASRDARPMMRKMMVCVSLVSLGCPGDDDSAESGVSAPATLSQGTEESGSEGTAMTTSISASSGSSEDSSSGAPTSGESSSSSSSSSSGGVSLCDPEIPGEWNSCHDEMGGV